MVRGKGKTPMTTTIKKLPLLALIALIPLALLALTGIFTGPPNINSAASQTTAVNNGSSLQEKGPRWSVVHTPAVSVQATASKTAGAAGVRHVADCVTASAGAAAAPTATNLTVNLRDGASGAGTIIWTTNITAAA